MNNSIKKIILASASPRRSAVLENAGLSFEIIASDYEEIIEDFNFSYKKIEELAFNKANVVAQKITQPALIIGADTVVVFDNKILGKPHDKEDAKKMLKLLNGKKHYVVTSHCIIDTTTNNRIIKSTTSHVEFENIDEEKIIEYIDEFSPLDKAGSYGIQELPVGFIKSIEGSFENIVGLCSKEIIKTLKEFYD